jgi:hypothetical protein
MPSIANEFKAACLAGGCALLNSGQFRLLTAADAELANLTFSSTAFGTPTTASPSVATSNAITADASAGTVPDTTIASWTVDDTDTRKQINLLNYYVYLVKTVPGAGGDAPDAYTVDIKDADASVVDIAARSTSAVEYVKGFDTLGVFPVVTGDMTLSVGDLGNSNKTTIYVYFLR